MEVERGKTPICLWQDVAQIYFFKIARTSIKFDRKLLYKKDLLVQMLRPDNSGQDLRRKRSKPLFCIYLQEFLPDACPEYRRSF